MGFNVESPWPYRDSLGEGPVWDPIDGSLIRIDVDRGLVHWLNVETGDQSTVSMGGTLGFAVPATTGEVVVSVGQQLIAVRKNGERRTLSEALDAVHGDPHGLNDGKVDSSGRLFAGTLNPKFDHGGGLYRFDRNCRTEKLVSDVTISNGLDWDDYRGRMYWTDSHEYRIDQFDYDVSTGEVTGRRPFATIDREDGMPDGMAVDAEGGLWVALFWGGKVRRYDPDGSISAEVAIPTSCPTSITFGGPDLTTAFVTSSSTWLKDEEKLTQPLGGAVFTFDAGVKGRAVTPFQL